jgi:hypothetical protein
MIVYSVPAVDKYRWEPDGVDNLRGHRRQPGRHCVLFGGNGFPLHPGTFWAMLKVNQNNKQGGQSNGIF